MNRIRGLDTIRFICALWVTIGHIGLPPLFGHAEHGIFSLLGKVYHSIINGPAAVIVFFLISGFCIHYPYRNGKSVHLSSFYIRRLFRIIMPFLISIPVSLLLGIHFSAMKTGIFWSLIAEMVYYLIYPLILILKKRFGLQKMIIVSFFVAYAIVMTRPRAGEYPSFGDALNWLVGLPCWMMGCWIAERSEGLPATNARSIWLYRGVVLIVSVVAILLRWHLPRLSIGFAWSLNLFGIVAYFWLCQEIIFFRRCPPPKALEWAGTWSYSLYLMHIPGAIGAKKLLPSLSTSGWSNLIFLIGAILSAYGFFLLVEKPSHLLAVRLSSLLPKDQEAGVSRT